MKANGRQRLAGPSISLCGCGATVNSRLYLMTLLAALYELQVPKSSPDYSVSDLHPLLKN